MLKSYYDEEPKIYHYFLAPAETVRKRLLIQGYTADFCKDAWERARNDKLEFYRSYASRVEGHFEDELNDIAAISFSDWLEGLSGRIASYPNGLLVDLRHYAGFDLLRSINDAHAQLALLLEATPKAPVWMECGALYNDDNDTRTPQQMLREDEGQYEDLASGKIIVLTEGKSDTRLISAALGAMYPEYATAYQFLDFDEFRIEGGASLLARMIKVLSGARVRNRMIALFDNDAAGLEAHRSLSGVRFPRNVRLMLLPETKLASSYPTLGPAGLKRMDVNKAGAPIELYLGRESLRMQDGTLRPIRWAQWIESVGRYQGVIQDKDAVSKAFRDAIAKVRSPAILRRRFPEMDLLLRTIFEAFEDLHPPAF
jgi:hypothetical protein